MGHGYGDEGTPLEMEATKGQDDTQLGATDSSITLPELKVMFMHCMIAKPEADGTMDIQGAHGWCMSPNTEDWEAERFANSVLERAGDGWKPFGAPNAMAVASADIVKALTAYDMAESQSIERDLQEGTPA